MNDMNIGIPSSPQHPIDQSRQVGEPPPPSKPVDKMVQKTIKEKIRSLSQSLEANLKICEKNVKYPIREMSPTQASESDPDLVTHPHSDLMDVQDLRNVSQLIEETKSILAIFNETMSQLQELAPGKQYSNFIELQTHYTHQIHDIELLLLQQAIISGDSRAVEALFSKGMKQDIQFENGMTPLTLAIKEGKNEIAVMLIRGGAEINAPDGNGNYPFLIAIEGQNVPMVMQLLSNPETDVDVQNAAGHTALIMGSFAGVEELVQGLIMRGAKLDKPNNEGQTAVIAAAAQGHENILKLLINAGANIKQQDLIGASALISAAFHGHLECVDIILEVGVDPEEHTALNGNTALHAAAISSHSEIVDRLIRAGADPLKTNDEGQDSLCLAALGTQKSNEGLPTYENIARHVDFTKIDSSKLERLLLSLALGGLEEPLKSLISKHPEIDLTSELGKKLLLTAAHNNQFEVLFILIQFGAKLNEAIDSSGQSPLTMAGIYGDLDNFEKLILLGGDPLHRDLNGLSAFDYLLLLNPHYASKNYNKYPQLLTDSMKHFNLPVPTFENDLDIAIAKDKLIEHLKLERSQLLHKRFEYPIDSSLKEAADSLYVQLRERGFDTDRLQSQNRDAYAQLQSKRMSGSTTIIGIGGASEKETAIVNWKTAENMVHSWAKNGEPLTSEKLCLLNSILNPKNPYANYRSSNVTGGGSRLMSYVPLGDVFTEIDQFFLWLDEKLEECEKRNENPIIVAALAYQRLVSIHPFNDGNGRTCRLVMDYILERFELPPACISDVNVAIFALLPQGKTPSDAVRGILEGLKNSENIFNSAK